MIGNTLEARWKGGEVLILAVFNGTPRPKALVLKKDSHLEAVDIAELDVLWHYDEQQGWVADAEQTRGP